MNKRDFLAASAFGLATTAIGVRDVLAQSDVKNGIRLGILYSLSGVMAFGEKFLKDVVLMTIAEINAAGGVLGRPIVPVVVDPSSDRSLLVGKARELIVDEHVSAVFGTSTSLARKAVLPVVEHFNNLLFYASQYEGEENSKNVFYTGGTPNQYAIPALEYMMSKEGGSVRRFFLLGTDYIYPRTTNRILSVFLHRKGVQDSEIEVAYIPFGHDDFGPIVKAIINFSRPSKTCVVSTVAGESSVLFYRELLRQGVKPSDVPVMDLTVEEGLPGTDESSRNGHLTAAGYFPSLDNPANARFKAEWRQWAGGNKLPKGSYRIINDTMASTYIGVHMWKAAVERAGTASVDKVRDAMIGLAFAAPSGFTLEMSRTRNLSRPAMVAEMQSVGLYDVVWQSKGTIVAQPFSPYLDDKVGKPDVVG
ncbi:transporter substrate-binding protein [Paraburkholderia madseniana]|uniref:Transporter substrate-binding protein n=1 Tax=Paraburkholderia madseniana TaxID=2599607 RepID=A0A6N6WG86_9BURK|nr:transporter substrate-binding protein [Paraburkholderia madseniana]KAE8759637.1 transporter substrate-binding protein [Paraburkholderia madseniana]